MAERDDAQMSELEAALRGLQPRADLNRDALMFRAGRASAQRGWGWRLAAGASAVLAGVFGLLFFFRLQSPAVERIVYLPAPSTHPLPPPEPRMPNTPAAPMESPYTPDWLPARNPRPLLDHLLRWGLDGLPPAPEPAPADSPANLLGTP
jgi:hypothetical protein